LEKLRLHSRGKNDFLKSLKERYNNLRGQILRDENLSEKDKETELKKIDKEFKKGRKDSENSLF